MFNPNVILANAFRFMVGKTAHLQQHVHCFHVHTINSLLQRTFIKCKRSGLKYFQSYRVASCLGSTYDRIFKSKNHKYSCKRHRIQRGVSQHLKDMKEDIRTIPNMLTMARMCSSPILGYLVIHGHYNSALGLFAAAGITDILDGYIARNWPGQMSVFGTALDPLADKILVSILTVSLSIAHLLPVWLTAVILLRDIALVAASAYTRHRVLPPPKTLARFFDVRIPTAKIYPSNISKVNTLLQLSAVGFSLAAPVFAFTDSPYLHALWYLTACTTAVSGLGYWYHAKKSFSIIKR